MIWRLRSVLFNLVFYGLTWLMLFLCLPFLLFPPKVQRQVPRMWVATAYWIERWVLGLDYVVIGKENLPPPPYIVAMKHQSAWETMKLYALFGNPAIVLKKELMSLPLWGRYAKIMEMVPIDRSKGREATKFMIEEARMVIPSKRPLVIFPQGTRVPVGKTKSYKYGVALLYKELHLPIVPVAHNAGVFWARNAFWKHPGKVTVEIMPVIPPGRDQDQVLQEVQAQIEDATNRLCRQAIIADKREKEFPELMAEANV